MGFRTRRRKRTGKIFLPTGIYVKVRLIPWLMTKNGCVWLASMAASKSNRQINDWMNRRKSRRVRRLDTNLTGKTGNVTQAIAIRLTRQMETWVPEGDSIAFRCESAKGEKQFRVWKRWFMRHESTNWKADEENKAFFFYRNRDLK